MVPKGFMQLRSSMVSGEPFVCSRRAFIRALLSKRQK